MAAPRHVAVIDIGKTNAKLALVDAEILREIAVLKTPNRAVNAAPYPHHDVDRLWSFILAGLAEFARENAIEAISITTHGATAALLDADGELALPVLDYEHDGPDTVAGEYDALRPPFSETGTPRLPLGLNLGAQIHWQAKAFPDRFAAVRSILPYPQYWAYQLSGVRASEVTSLGCHTDLWSPARRDFSALVDAMGWRGLMPPLRAAGDRLGPILPKIARRTGLDPQTPVLCGLHDSNASLLPHLVARKHRLSVVSTGTWVVTMAVGGRQKPLDEARDTLVNVSALGTPVPSARFMGGREYEMLTAGLGADWTQRDVERVLAERILLLPSVQQGSGPFPHSSARWMGQPGPGERLVAASFYLALMTATCLDLIGADGDIVVEGPFGKNALFGEMLGAATGRPVLPQDGRETGTTTGAALLATGSAGKQMPTESPEARPVNQSFAQYADAWRKAVAEICA
ncbi:sugar (pentulose or hexulose) kinase [Mesorhizobium soli]|uniref:FGGY-family carbohydrate kinase n=1 Tax=Pseudaminobacter soli (ex Li et al. 2025) TaxID=1295366 RepID=UPI002476F11E|nr:FGGY-family carbohydrate kinase [Mesorhizobium soli]MDH6230401.1 sugar (pentulose or hexulose) kinase [Mesorhizobium soli]